MNITRNLAIILSVGSCVFTASAIAGSPFGSQQQVRFADLHLSNDSDAAALYRRIEAAAKTVCSVDSGPQTLARMVSTRACFKTATAQAVLEVNNPNLTHQYLAKTGGQKLIEVAARR